MRTSPKKFAHLAEKSEQGSISNLSTKREAALVAVAERRHPRRAGRGGLAAGLALHARRVHALLVEGRGLELDGARRRVVLELDVAGPAERQQARVRGVHAADGLRVPLVAT